jgi:hypothetical protein
MDTWYGHKILRQMSPSLTFESLSILEQVYETAIGQPFSKYKPNLKHNPE